MTEKDSADSALHEQPFYGMEILRRQQHEFVRDLLKKYRGQPVTEELKKKIWEELQREKHLGRLTMPFKMTTRYDPYGKFPPVIEIILDTKV